MLVVDDERPFARRLAMAFEEAGFRANLAHDGLDALDRIEESLPDLIVLDVRMPGLDGLACLRRLHRRHQGRIPPVVLLTGDPSPRVDAAALVYPDTTVLAKPCSYEDVVVVGERLLEL